MNKYINTYLFDILNSIDEINEYISDNRTYEHYCENRILQRAIERNLEIIGEAANNVSDDLKQSYPDVLWKEIRGMRNFVTHQYFGVELSEIWSTIINDIPLLKNQIQKIIEDIEK